MRTVNGADRPQPDADEIEGATDTGEQPALTLGEVASAYEISRSSLRRKLKANKVPGAYQITGAHADEWRVPVAALDSMGIKRRSPEPAKPPGTAISPTSLSFARMTPSIGARSVV